MLLFETVVDQWWKNFTARLELIHGCRTTFHACRDIYASDQRLRVAGNGTECEVKTTELSLPTSGGEQ